MEHELRLFTSEDLKLPRVTPEIPRRQIEAIHTGVDIDLNESSVDYGLALVGGLDPGTAAFLVVADGNRDVGERIATKYRLALIVLPPEVMVNVYSWALVTTKGTVWSRPT